MKNQDNNYYAPDEITLYSSEEWDRHFMQILQHEIAGLLSLWGKQRWREIKNETHTWSPFYNRIYFKKKGDIPRNYKWSVICNPYLIEDTIWFTESFEHCQSSLVFWQELACLTISDVDTLTRTVQTVSLNQDFSFNDYLSLFGLFFKKKDEGNEALKNRLKANIQKGTHLVLYDNQKPVWIVWVIELNRIASIYSFLILPWQSDIHAHRVLWNLLIKHLKWKGDIDFVYLKTRNKAVELFLKKYTNMKFLYSEHIYHGK